MLSLWIIWLGICALVSSFYVPATPINDTDIALQQSLSQLEFQIQLYHSHIYSVDVLHLLSAKRSHQTQVNEGTLLHLSSEADVDSYALPVKGIRLVALVSCDRSGVFGAPGETDVFTLARNNGASAVFLYSLTSSACILDPAHSIRASDLDVYSLKDHIPSSRLANVINESASHREARRSRDTSSSASLAMEPRFILGSLHTSEPRSIHYGPRIHLYARDGNGKGGPSLAMIVLYSITGCVSALFILVIVSGAVRAMRHPEQYGPRAFRQGSGSDSVTGFGPMTVNRARGLTQAILDTFPVFKFANVSQDGGTAVQRTKDVESNPGSCGHKAELGPSGSNSTPPSSFVVESGDWLAISSSLDKVQCDLTLTNPVTGEGVGPVRQGDHRLRHSVAGSHDIAALQEVGKGKQDAMAESEVGPSSPRNQIASQLSTSSSASEDSEPSGTNSNTKKRPSGEPSRLASTETDMVPPGIGHDTCPICIVDFEEGDDLRMLPCEGKHVFHQQCVDPWLLELSSSCPLCRHDFLALENLISGSVLSLSGPGADHEEEEARYNNRHSQSHAHPHASRFSRYLRFALRRRGGGGDGGGGGGGDDEEEDPTDPYMPEAAHTAL